MAGIAQGDALGRRVGDAEAVRDAFEQAPVILMATTGGEHRITAMNAACRALTRRSDVIGAPFREVFPEAAGQYVFELLDRVYATGQAQGGTEWRGQVNDADGEIAEVYADFQVAPRRDATGVVDGLLVVAFDVSARVLERQATQQRATEAEHRYEAVREVVAELQQALLPTTLPVLPRARIAARYLVAGHEQAAGGDWFDAIPLPGGRVALVVGDVVGHGVTASAAMGQLRAVLAELLVGLPAAPSAGLAGAHDLDQVLARLNAYAARAPELHAATLVLAVLDPADGRLRYATCGHPPPLVVSPDGIARFLDGTGAGPLGTAPDSALSGPELASPELASPALAEARLGPGEVLLLYSDGLIERPDRTLDEGMAELAGVAGDAAANRMLTAGAAASPADRVCQLTVELLTRTGYADDVTTLAVERLAEPVGPLHLELPAERDSLTVARRELVGWLHRLDAAEEDSEALHLAMVEIVTNAIEHAYPPGQPGRVELDAALSEDGAAEIRVADHGTWQAPDPAPADRGHGLMVAGQVVDNVQVTHPAGTDSSAAGTSVRLRHRLSRPAVLGTAHHSARPAGYPDEPAFGVDSAVDRNGTARARVRGPVNINTADQLARRLLAICRGGTMPLIADLSGVTQLASAGVRALFLVRQQLTAHRQPLTLLTAPNSSVRAVLDLVRLPRGDGSFAFGV